MGPAAPGRPRTDELLSREVEAIRVAAGRAGAYAFRMRFWKASEGPGAAGRDAPAAFDPNTTRSYQAKLKGAPVWFCSFLAGNNRESRRLRDELATMKGAWPLLMKQRNGGTWTPEEKQQLKRMVRSASSVSPYLFIWALPGSVVLLPFLAWYLDRRKQRRK